MCFSLYNFQDNFTATAASLLIYNPLAGSNQLRHIPIFPPFLTNSLYTGMSI